VSEGPAYVCLTTFGPQLAAVVGRMPLNYHMLSGKITLLSRINYSAKNRPVYIHTIHTSFGQ